jgi:hypothetical protein
LTAARVDPATGSLLIGGGRVFPIGLSDPPPVDSTAPGTGLPAWAEIARAGVNFVRNYTVWTPSAAEEQMIPVALELDAAREHEIQVWLALAGLDNDLTHARLLEQIVDTVKGHPGLGAWKGADEPAHGHVPPSGCIAVYKRVRTLDPDHPVVIIEAPRAPGPTRGSPDRRLTAAAVRPYAAACDIHGIDIYPVSRPPGRHAGGPPVNTDISVVGDMTRLIVAATRRKAIWTTLQIAWSGVFPPHPVVLPTFEQARFMAYDAIVAGARGLFFFGGQFKQVMNAADRAHGWNWTYWRNVQRPLVEELSDAEHTAALTAPVAAHAAGADAADVATSTRQTSEHVYLIAVRRSATASSRVRFHGLPAAIREGTVLAHPGGNPARSVTVANGAFTDPSPYRPHNARVYRFPHRP